MYRKFHKLRVRFAELDLSQAEAARRAGIPPSTLTARIATVQNPRACTIYGNTACRPALASSAPAV